jgi:general secretion pathway protein D
VIKHDVLNITSGDQTNTSVYTKSYPIGDLIIPIPNFVPDGREGISAALEQGYRRAGYGGGFGGFGATAAPSVMIAKDNSASPVSPAVNAQFLDRPNSPPATGVPQQINFGGPGGLGGGSQADFDSLIDLITTTIAPTSWDTVGGPGSVAPFETNLTLVVSQTQEVHEQIADLLQQLRRLQDLQVTIEVRFINLSDNFFERIGVDFDFNIDDNFTQPAIPISSDNGRSSVIGLEPVGNLTPTLNLDLQFRQGSFGATLPNVPGALFDPTTAGTFGFAILSDIEAFFLITAAQGDTRSNILQAPKITLFNGQTAFVSDTTQRPFVTSIIPVVGDFAAAHQPVIVVLSEGTSLSVQAIVSNDRRFLQHDRRSRVVYVHGIEVDDQEEQRLEQEQRRRRRIELRRRNHERGRHYGAVADVPVRDCHQHHQRARRRHGAVGRHQALERDPHRARATDPEQTAVYQSLVQERGHWPFDQQPDDDGHAADHHPGGGRGEPDRDRGAVV